MADTTHTDAIEIVSNVEDLKLARALYAVVTGSTPGNKRSADDLRDEMLPIVTSNSDLSQRVIDAATKFDAKCASAVAKGAKIAVGKVSAKAKGKPTKAAAKPKAQSKLKAQAAKKATAPGAATSPLAPLAAELGVSLKVLRAKLRRKGYSSPYTVDAKMRAALTD